MVIEIKSLIEGRDLSKITCRDKSDEREREGKPD